MLTRLSFALLALQKFETVNQFTALESLTITELHQYHTIKIPEKQQAWLLGRLAAKEVICCFHHDSLPHLLPTDLVIYNDESGAPKYKILNHPVTSYGHLSISHTLKLGVAGIVDSYHAVGVDVEQIRDWHHTTITAFTTLTEQQILSHLSPTKQNLHTTLLWSAKEAYLKLIKTGLRKHPRFIEINIAKNTLSIFDEGTKQTTKSFWTQYDETYIITLIIQHETLRAGLPTSR